MFTCCKGNEGTQKMLCSLHVCRDISIMEDDFIILLAGSSTQNTEFCQDEVHLEKMFKSPTGSPGAVSADRLTWPLVVMVSWSPWWW